MLLMARVVNRPPYAFRDRLTKSAGSAVLNFLRSASQRLITISWSRGITTNASASRCPLPCTHKTIRPLIFRLSKLARCISTVRKPQYAISVIIARSRMPCGVSSQVAKTSSTSPALRSERLCSRLPPLIPLT